MQATNGQAKNGATWRLLSPITINKLRLDNRIVMPPFEHDSSDADGYVTQTTLDWHARLAGGGLGLLITGATVVNPDLSLKKNDHISVLGDDKYIPGQRRLTDVIHKGGTKTFVQLVDKTLMARQQRPADLTLKECWNLVDYFVAGAKRAKEAGFDGVDYHFAHGYTISQFLSKETNKRRDQFGRGVEGRMKIAVEILRRSREVVGPDFPLVPRFNGDEYSEFGNNLRDTAVMAQMFIDAGADALDVSVGGGAWRIIPPAQMPDGLHVHVAEGIKKAIKNAVPVIAVGKIGSPWLAEEVLQEGKSDLVAMGRQIFLDPETPRKVLEGRFDDILPCGWCNFCHREHGGGRMVTCCVLNKMDTLGRERALAFGQNLAKKLAGAR